MRVMMKNYFTTQAGFKMISFPHVVGYEVVFQDGVEPGEKGIDVYLDGGFTIRLHKDNPKLFITEYREWAKSNTFPTAD